MNWFIVDWEIRKIGKILLEEQIKQITLSTCIQKHHELFIVLNPRKMAPETGMSFPTILLLLRPAFIIATMFSSPFKQCFRSQMLGTSKFESQHCSCPESLQFHSQFMLQQPNELITIFAEQHTCNYPQPASYRVLHYDKPLIWSNDMSAGRVMNNSVQPCPGRVRALSGQ